VGERAIRRASALGVMFIVALFFLVMLAQFVGRKYGIKEA
jgi:iron(III) transport system permease protein